MILRYCVCVPTYNNPNTLKNVVSDILKNCTFPVLIIDDGSDIEAKQVLSRGNTDSGADFLTEALKSGRLSIQRHNTNQGKGAAIRSAIKIALSQGFTHILTIDADGQHQAQDIHRLVDISLKHPWDLVVGNRKMIGPNVPEVSRFGRKFSNFWVHYQTGQTVADSQSGFRLYPLFHLQSLKFWTQNFDFEIEILIRLMWKGVSIREVEIDVLYQSKEERVSHFHKFFDNLRISALNTVFVILSLLKSHRSPRELGLSIGIGVFIGTTPFFGFHTLIVAAAAFVLRLNAAYMWLGSQISIPVIAPFLVAASIKIGKFLTGHSVIAENGFSFSQGAEAWLIGSLVLGTLLGAIIGTSSALIARALKRQNRLWSGKTRGGRLGNGFMKILIAQAGIKPAYMFLWFIVPYFYIFAPKARRSANEYWTHIQANLSWRERQIKVLKQMYVFAQILVDRTYQATKGKNINFFSTRPHGMENIRETLKKGQGLILMCAHVGGWDLSAALLPIDGFRGEFFMLEYQSEGLTLQKATQHKDESHLKRIHHNQMEQPLLQVRALLQAGKAIGIMGDRPLSHHYELVSFLGGLVAFDTTPFRLAIATGVPLLTTFGFKISETEYSFYAGPAKIYNRNSVKNPSEQILVWAQEYANTLENYIRQYPEQWFNFFPMWSAEPSQVHSESAKRLQHHLYTGEYKLAKPLSESEVVPIPNV